MKKASKFVRSIKLLLVMLGSKLTGRSVLAALAIGLFGSFMTYGGLSGKPGYREVSVEKGDITASVLTTGRVQPDNRIDVKAPLPGRAERVLVKMGDKVKKGQPLVLMSTTDRASVIDTARYAKPQELAYWEKTLRPTTILSPVSGTVIQRNIEEGQTFTEADAILVLADSLVIEAPVDETDIGKLRKGQPTLISLDAFPAAQLLGKIRSIGFESMKENDVITYRIRVEFNSIPEFVRVGMTANVKLDIASSRGTLLLPIEAMKATENSMFVLVPASQGDDAPERRMIEAGLSDGRKVEILQGLQAGDTVLIPERRAVSKSEKRSSSSAFGFEHGL